MQITRAFSGCFVKAAQNWYIPPQEAKGGGRQIKGADSQTWNYISGVCLIYLYPAWTPLCHLSSAKC